MILLDAKHKTQHRKHLNVMQEYADGDTQLHISFSPSFLNTSLSSVQTWFFSARNFFFHYGLALNPDKTEASCMGTAARLRSFNNLTSVQMFESVDSLSPSVILLRDTFSGP